MGRPLFHRPLVAAGLTWLALVAPACSNDDGASASPTTVASSSTAPEAARPARLDIVAKDFEWSGLPDVIAAGSYPMSFRNDGTEAHEISIFRNPDGVDVHEIAKAGPAGMKDLVEPAGMLIAPPGTSAPNELTLELTPGEYEVVCFIPNASGDGSAHFEHGMHRTLTVV